MLNRKALPFAEVKRVRLTCGPWLDSITAMAKEQWAGIGKYPGGGFTLFDENAERWLLVAEQLERQQNEGEVVE